MKQLHIGIITLSLALTACVTTPVQPDTLAQAPEEVSPAQTWQTQRGEVIQMLRTNAYLNVVEHGNGEILVHIRSGDSFRTAQTAFSESLVSALEHIAATLHPQPALHIKVVGHTDSVGNADHNLRLSIDRARAARDFLIEAGIDESRIAYDGAGQTDPIAPNTSAEGRAVNRRVDVLIVPAH